jgi:transposase-like protein
MEIVGISTDCTVTPHAVREETLEAIREAMQNGARKAAVCRTFGVKRSTLYDALARETPEPHH